MPSGDGLPRAFPKVGFSDPYGIAESLLEGRFYPVAWLGLCLKSYELLNEAGAWGLVSGAFLGSRIAIMPHQVSAVLKVRDGMEGRALLADEVGLGKTIEACMIYSEYALMGLASKVLILTPPALTRQWQDELRTKFLEEFTVASPRDPEFKGYDKHEKMIISMDTAKRPGAMEKICRTRWDLLIVDEAHRLKNSRTQNYKLVKAISSRYLLLLTATPLQNNLVELYNLVDLVRPGLLGSRLEFESRFLADSRGRKVANRPALQDLLSRVMVRTTRKETNLPFTERFSKTLRIQPKRSERELYEAVTEYVRSRYLALPRARRERPAADVFLLITLQRQLASSTPAISKALRRRMEKAGPGESGEIAKLLRLAEASGEDSKCRAVKELVESTPGKILIFTTFLETQEYVRASLENSGTGVACYSGAMGEEERQKSLAAFREGAKVLVCTEAGSEGMNLQFCNVVVNYDLPWNPLRVEQRIGRVHRLGQEKDVYIFNLTMRGTIEDYILELLYEKIRLFQLTIGDLELILGDEVRKIEPRIFRSFMEKGARGAKRAIERMGLDLARKRDLAEAVKKRNEAVLEGMRLSPLGGGGGE
ncbi:MAG: DEAD/DEAH box helicase [Candidatus Brockarchaeota archaeon]|nr:DEAD/DEAH box helicase [Candidatus Brockarchaeota archaeon]